MRMKLIGFNFNKISIERFSSKYEGLKIDTKINVLELGELDSKLFKTEDKLLSVKFEYMVDYATKIAKIELVGDILLGIDSKLMKDILEQWKKKKMPEDFKVTLFNIILRKSNVKALELEEDLNLPLHIPLPNLKKQEKNQE